MCGQPLGLRPVSAYRQRIGASAPLGSASDGRIIEDDLAPFKGNFPGIDVMSKSRRGTVIWLAMLGIAVALIVLASASTTSAISPVLAFAVLIAYLGLVVGSLVNVSLSTLRLSMPRVAAATRVTPAARKAVQRARARSGYSSDATLTDVGLIVNERLSNGQLDR